MVNTACLNINFTGENDITLDKAYPMKPEELENFLSKATPYHFTIENTCDELANATINLESLNAGVEKQLQDEYIDAILYETDYHTNLNSEKQLNESMYNDENKVIKNSLHAYELYNFVLQKGETKSFNLLLYMDANTPMETTNMNATWKGKITLSAGYKEEPTANLNGLKVPVVESGDGLYAVSHDVSEISTDWNKTEYRYAGVNVNNYVSFNNEIWRIIGLVNVKINSGIEQRLKILRQDGVKEQKDFGMYSWDYKLNGVGSSNSDYGSDDWTDSQLKDMLNGIYYNSETGDCYKYEGNGVSEQCNFSTDETMPHGIETKFQRMIDDDVIWTLGKINAFNVFVKQTYIDERGSNTSNNHQIEWSSTTDVGGKHNGIGLMYASDYGYATNGGSLGRETCFEKSLNSWYMDDYNTNCINNNWLKGDNNIWTLSSMQFYTHSPAVIHSSGYLYTGNARNSYKVWPTLYLKSSVKITPNPHPEQEYGTVDNPFQLSVQ